MSFTGSWITIHNNVSTFFYKRQCCKLRKKVPAFGRKFLQFKFLQIFHLRERSFTYFLILPVLNALLNLIRKKSVKELSISQLYSVASAIISSNWSFMADNFSSLRQAVITSFSVVCLSIAYCFLELFSNVVPFSIIIVGEFSITIYIL